MTFVEFVQSYAKRLESVRFEKERAGQALFNELSLIRPDLADKMRGRTADPFYDDTRLGLTWAWIALRWED